MVKYTVIFLILIGTALGEDIYVAQTAQGADNGTNAANAKSLSWLNSAANWGVGAAKVSPGDTVHLVGTLTSQFIVPGSGSSGSPVTILFESGANFTAPVWPTNGAIVLNGVSWLVIDGGTNGFIMNTQNGPQRTFKQNSRGIGGNGAGDMGICFNTIIQNLIIKEIFYKTPAMNNEQRLGYGIDLGGSDITVQNCRVSDGDGTIGYTALARGSRNINILNNISRNSNHNITLGTADSNADVTNVTISGNDIDDLITWDYPPGEAIHLNGIMIFNNNYDTTCTITNIRICNNNIGPNIGFQTTAAMFNSLQGAAQQLINVYIYNNVIEAPIATAFWGNGAFAIDGKNVWVFNNTLVGAITAGQPTLGNTASQSIGGWYASPVRVNNNLFHTTNGLAVRSVVLHSQVPADLSQTGSATSFILTNFFQNLFTDYNVYSNGNPSGSNPSQFSTMLWDYQAPVVGGGGAWISGGIVGLPGWQTWYNNNRGMPTPIWNTTHADPHSKMAPPNFIAGTLVPSTTDTVARGAGLNLASIFAEMSTNFGFTITPTDYNGNARPASGNWTIGAFETGGAPVDSPPTITSKTIPSAGTSISLVFSENVTVNNFSGFTISVSGTPITLSAGTIVNPTTISYTLSRPATPGEVIRLTYTPVANGIEDSSGQDLAGFSFDPVTNLSTIGQVATPVFSPLPGAYSSTQNVSMSITPSPPGAVIRYTANGTDPTTLSTPYTAPIPTSLSTTYKARAFANGFLDSAIATGAYQIGDFVINLGVFSNVAVATQTGTFTWSFRATSSAANNDAVMSLADHTVAAYADMAVITRFGPSGNIDAFNGTTGGYAAVNAFPYVAGQAYDFLVTVNVPAHTYSMTVVQAGGSSPTTIATNYAFRSTQASVVDLDVFAGYSSLASATVSNMVFTPVTAVGISMTGMVTNTAGTQLTATFNNQPSFGLGGQGGFTVSASGGAVVASSPNLSVANAITWTLSRTIGRGESLSATYVQPGNGIEAASGGSDLASFAGQTVLNNSTVDLTAPTPNPSTFGIAPTALTSSTITMTATTSSDTFTGPVSYFFNEVSGNAGGSDSGWQSSATFTDAGLAAGTQYRYRVQTRDSAVPPNVTTFSQEFSATTKSVAGARPAQPFNMARANIVTP